MTTEVTVPKLSATMEDARVARWCRQIGDDVREGDVLLELETDKAVLEVEATASGKLSRLLAREGEVVAVGAVIAILGEGDSSVSPPVNAAEPASKATPPAPRLEAVDESGIVSVSSSGGMLPLARPPAGRDFAIRATPLAKRMAAENGIELHTIAGTGPRNRISRRDVEKAAASRTSTAPVGVPSAVVPPPAEAPRPAPSVSSHTAALGEAGEISRMRQAIAAQVSESRRTIPSFVLDRWVDLELLEDARALFNRRLAPEERLTITDLVLQAIADVLPRHPQMSMVWQDGSPTITRQAEAGAIGMVVGLDEGVMIPVLKGLDGAGLSDISRQRRHAMDAVRSGRLGAAFSGKPTLSVSNIGRVGVDRFEAIISPGETAILAIGRVHQRAAVIQGGVKAQTGANFTLSVDHRTIDGLVGGAFLGALADRIERQTWRL